MVRCVNVLIADSNQSLIDDLTKRLEEQEGFRVTGAATDGQQAVELLRSCKPELLVLDLMLPKLDGVAVLKAANELEHRPASVVLASTFTASSKIEMASPATHSTLLPEARTVFVAGSRVAVNVIIPSSGITTSSGAGVSLVQDAASAAKARKRILYFFIRLTD